MNHLSNNLSNRAYAQDTTAKEIFAACMTGVVIVATLFAVWAPQDAKYELQAFVRFLNHLI